MIFGNFVFGVKGSSTLKEVTETPADRESTRTSALTVMVDNLENSRAVPAACLLTELIRASEADFTSTLALIFTYCKEKNHFEKCTKNQSTHIFWKINNFQNILEVNG